MILAVMLKAVPDTTSGLDIDNDGKSLVRENVKFVMNPYDEYALEEAVKLKESLGGEVVAVCAGNEQFEPVIRSALAAGADRAILVQDNEETTFQPGKVSRAITNVLKELAPDLVLAGRQAVDTDNAQVPERTAEMMNVPHVSIVTKVTVQDEILTIHQEMEGGYRIIDITLPALITIQKGINVPRYPTVPDVMKARRKPLEIRELEGVVCSQKDQSGVEVDALVAALTTRTGKILSGDLDTQISELSSILNGVNSTG